MIFVNKRAEGIDDIITSANDDELVRFWGELFEDVFETAGDATKIEIVKSTDSSQVWTHKITTNSKRGKVEWVVFDY